MAYSYSIWNLELIEVWGSCGPLVPKKQHSKTEEDCKLKLRIRGHKQISAPGPSKYGAADWSLRRLKPKDDQKIYYDRKISPRKPGYIGKDQFMEGQTMSRRIKARRLWKNSRENEQATRKGESSWRTGNLQFGRLYGSSKYVTETLFKARSVEIVRIKEHIYRAEKNTASHWTSDVINVYCKSGCSKLRDLPPLRKVSGAERDRTERISIADQAVKGG